MIVKELMEMRNVSMVDGCFDPIHPGHIEYFKLAQELGNPVFCNVTGDSYLKLKHTPLLTHTKRTMVIDAIKYIDFVYKSDRNTADVLKVLKPKCYVKGIDWKTRGLPKEQVALCKDLDIEIIYLDTVIDSSSEILESFRLNVEREP